MFLLALNQVAGDIQVVDRIDNRPDVFAVRQVLQQYFSDAEMDRLLFIFGDQAVGGFVDTVVCEPETVGFLHEHSDIEYRLDIPPDLFGQTLSDLCERGDVPGIAQAGRQFQRDPRFFREAVELPEHQFGHVVGGLHCPDAIDIPLPARRVCEFQEPIFVGGLEEKFDEESVAAGLSVDLVGNRRRGFGRTAERFRDQDTGVRNIEGRE